MTDEQTETEVLAVRVPRALVKAIDGLIPKLKRQSPKGMHLSRADVVRHLLTFGVDFESRRGDYGGGA